MSIIMGPPPCWIVGRRSSQQCSEQCSDLFPGLPDLIPVAHPHLQRSMLILNSEDTGPWSGIDVSQAENLNGRRWSTMCLETLSMEKRRTWFCCKSKELHSASPPTKIKWINLVIVPRLTKSHRFLTSQQLVIQGRAALLPPNFLPHLQLIFNATPSQHPRGDPPGGLRAPQIPFVASLHVWKIQPWHVADQAVKAPRSCSTGK